jgi:hypothetical protein
MAGVAMVKYRCAFTKAGCGAVAAAALTVPRPTDQPTVATVTKMRPATIVTTNATTDFRVENS